MKDVTTHTGTLEPLPREYRLMRARESSKLDMECSVVDFIKARIRAGTSNLGGCTTDPMDPHNFY